MNDITTIPALGDNYIYLYCYSQNRAIAVDPCQGRPVLNELENKGLNLTSIFVTHHHRDHRGGIKELKDAIGCEVLCFDKSRIPEITTELTDGQIVELGREKLKANFTPGHTRDSACFHLLPSEKHRGGILWTGDTLFVGGCGRIFECPAEVMWDSLCKLSAFAGDTLVYCGHNYAVENFKFSLSIEPENKKVKKRLEEAIDADNKGEPTVPSSIEQELLTNIFLRSGALEISEKLGMAGKSSAEVFRELRRRKDAF